MVVLGVARFLMSEVPLYVPKLNCQHAEDTVQVQDFFLIHVFTTGVPRS